MTTIRDIFKKSKEVTKNITNKTLDTELEPVAYNFTDFVLAALRTLLFLILSLTYLGVGFGLLNYFFEGFTEGNLYYRLILIIIFIIFIRLGYFQKIVKQINKIKR